MADKINQVDGLPRIPGTKIFDFSRTHFLDGTLKAYFAPGQTPLTTVPGFYQKPTDWAKENTLLRVPKMLWISLNFGDIYLQDVTTPDQVDITFGNVDLYSQHNWQVVNVPARDDVSGPHTTHTNAFKDYNGLSIVSQHYSDGGLVDIPDSSITTPGPPPHFVPDGQTAKYLATRAALLDLVKSIPILSNGKARAILIDYTTFQLVPDQPLDREYFSGGEVLDDTGTRIASFFGSEVDVAADGYWLSELISPLSTTDEYLGTNFLHIHVGLYTALGGHQTDDLFTPSGRLAASTISTEWSKFSNYSTRFVGLGTYDFNYTITGKRYSNPVHVTFPTLVDEPDYGGSTNDLYFAPAKGFIHTVLDSPSHSTVTWADAVPFITYSPNVSQTYLDTLYDQQVALHNAGLRVGTLGTLTFDFNDNNALLQAEANALAAYDFTYLGDTNSVSVENIRTLVLAHFEL